jgi:hypothetical protein
MICTMPNKPGSNQYRTRAGGRDKVMPAAAHLLALAGQASAPAVIEGYWCENCGTGFEDGAELITLYECGSCGEISAERRCGQCHRFAGRADTPGCPSCEQPVETEVQLVYDHDGELVRSEDYEPGGEAVAAREARHRQQADQRRAQQLRDKTARVLAGAQRTTWDQVPLGRRVAFVRDGQPDISEWAEQPLVLDILRPGPRSDAFPGLVVALVQRYSQPDTVHMGSDEPVLLLAGEPEPAQPWVSVSGPVENPLKPSPYAKAEVHLRGMGVDIVGTNGYGQGWVVAHLFGPGHIRQVADALDQLLGPGETAEIMPQEPADIAWWRVSGDQVHRLELSMMTSGGRTMLRLGRAGYAGYFEDMAQCRGLAAALRRAASRAEQRLDLAP